MGSNNQEVQVGSRGPVVVTGSLFFSFWWLWFPLCWLHSKEDFFPHEEAKEETYWWLKNEAYTIVGDEQSVLWAELCFQNLPWRMSLFLTKLQAWKSSLIPEEWLCFHFPQIPKSDSIHHMSRIQMRPELPPLPASANEEPSELYKVCSRVCCPAAGTSGGPNSQDLTSGISGFGHFGHRKRLQQWGRKGCAVAQRWARTWPSHIPAVLVKFAKLLHLGL